MSTMRSRLALAVDPVSKLASYVDLTSTQAGVVTDDYTCLKYLPSGTASFNCLSIIPRLVSFYGWIYDNLGYELTIEGAAAPMSHIFEMLL